MRSFFLVIFLFFSLAITQELKCPSVFDGLTNGHFDLSTQFSNNTMSANWIDLLNDEVLSYECSVISESLLRNELAPCRLVQGFPGIPNIKNWVNVRKDNFVTFNKLSLTPEYKYIVVVRTTLRSGVQIFSNSDGITILPYDLSLEGSTKQLKTVNIRQNPIITEEYSTSKIRTAVLGHDKPCYVLRESCPIEQENIKRASTISVQDFLNEFYGPPQYIDDRLLFVLPVVSPKDSDDDDDSAANHGKIGGVVGGVLLLMLLCLCLLALLALLFSKGSDEPPFGERIIENKREYIDADIGSSVQHSIGSETRVEFPDISQGRLSQA